MLKCLFITFLFVICYLEAKRVMYYNKFGNCPDYPNLPVRSTYFKVHNYAKNNRSAEQKFEVKKELKGNLAMVANLIKCDISGAPDTCEYFIKDFKVTNLCKKMSEKGQAWTPFIEGFRPPISCPIQPGNYTTESTSNEDHALKFFPVPTGVWRAKAFLQNDEEILLCGEFDVKIMDVRRA